MTDKKLNWSTESNQRLVSAFLSLRTKKEAQNFLRDLMTEYEILEFANRLTAAKMLAENEIYIKIEKETGLSSTTVARVSKWLNSKGGGYKQILSKISHHTSPKKLQRDLS